MSSKESWYFFIGIQSQTTPGAKIKKSALIPPSRQQMLRNNVASKVEDFHG